jgi:hypothetical protein
MPDGGIGSQPGTSHSSGDVRIDRPDFAKQQLQHLATLACTNGELPHEWNFGDANPPGLRAAWRVFRIDRKSGKKDPNPGDLDFLKRILQKQLLTFTWWVKKRTTEPKPIQGGFLGLTTQFDRTRLPMGGTCQADGTSWMAMSP